MKHFRWLFCALILLFPLIVLAETPQFLVFDPLNDGVEVVGSNYRTISQFKAGESPYKTLTLPNNQGYVILYRGSGKFFGLTNKPGGIIFLDPQFKPIAKKISFPGLVINEKCLENSSKWVILSSDNSKSGAAVINIIDLKSGNLEQFPLDGLPSAYRFFSDQKVALTLLGNPDKKIQPQVVIVDLIAMKSQSYPVSLNPGAIYFINENQILVGCGGFRDSIKYLANLIMETSSKSTPASIYIIDTATGKTGIIESGFAPLVVLQDKNQPDTFYVGSTKDAYAKDSGGRFQLIKGNKLAAEIPVPGEPVSIVQPATGNICLLGREEFFLINPAKMEILTKLAYDLKTEDLRLSQDEKTGYLSFTNSSYIRVINLQTGGSDTEIKISKGLLGGFGMGDLFPNPYPPVIGMDNKPGLEKKSVSTDSRMFFSPDYSMLYALSGRSVMSVVDARTNQVKSEIKFTGKAFGIHPAPNGKFIVVATDIAWHLLSPDKNKPVLTVNLSKDEPMKFSIPGFYSPDGKTLVIPYEKNLFVVDVEQAKFIGKFKTKIKNGKVVWPE